MKLLSQKIIKSYFFKFEPSLDLRKMYNFSKTMKNINFIQTIHKLKESKSSLIKFTI